VDGLCASKVLEQLVEVGFSLIRPTDADAKMFLAEVLGC
jgi:hypothetical protein